MYDIPILLIFFNREEVVMQTLAMIKEARPERLYLACDGARDDVKEERAKIQTIREKVLSQIDWPCEVKTRFLDNNIGCSLGVCTAIDWLFQNEETGIILEDDCRPQRSFFPFMKEMLQRYKDDQRIGMVDGANYIKNYTIKDSYCFSKYKSTNGWGTWRRSWLNMDLDMQWRGTHYQPSIIKNIGYRAKDIRYWHYRLKAIDCGHVSAWDWQWYLTLSAQNQLSIFPKVSLISNIGFGKDATHTSFASNPDHYLAHQELSFPLYHPQYVLPDYDFDRCFYHANNTLYNRINQLIPFKLKRKVKNIIKSLCKR